MLYSSPPSPPPHILELVSCLIVKNTNFKRLRFLGGEFLLLLEGHELTNHIFPYFLHYLSLYLCGIG